MNWLTKEAETVYDKVTTLGKKYKESPPEARGVLEGSWRILLDEIGLKYQMRLIYDLDACTLEAIIRRIRFPLGS